MPYLVVTMFKVQLYIIIPYLAVTIFRLDLLLRVYFKVHDDRFILMD